MSILENAKRMLGLEKPQSAVVADIRETAPFRETPTPLEIAAQKFIQMYKKYPLVRNKSGWDKIQNEWGYLAYDDTLRKTIDTLLLERIMGVGRTLVDIRRVDKEHKYVGNIVTAIFPNEGVFETGLLMDVLAARVAHTRRGHTQGEKIQAAIDEAKIMAHELGLPLQLGHEGVYTAENMNGEAIAQALLTNKLGIPVAPPPWYDGGASMPVAA